MFTNASYKGYKAAAAISVSVIGKSNHEFNPFAQTGIHLLRSPCRNYKHSAQSFAKQIQFVCVR